MSTWVSLSGGSLFAAGGGGLRESVPLRPEGRGMGARFGRGNPLIGAPEPGGLTLGGRSEVSGAFGGA
jgi:hypothetical protein